MLNASKLFWLGWHPSIHADLHRFERQCGIQLLTLDAAPNLEEG
jgi:hypothetical protein